MLLLRGVVAIVLLSGVPILACEAQFATLGAGVLLSDRKPEPVLERSVLETTRVSAGIGAGLLWLEGNDYRPYPIAVASGVVPLPIPRTAVVAIASTQPFQDFAWSLVLKVSFTLLSK